MVAMALIRSSHPCLDLMLELLHNETLQKKLSLNEDRQSAKRRASVGTLELGTHGKKKKREKKCVGGCLALQKPPASPPGVTQFLIEELVALFTPGAVSG